ncbi:MAG: hypothetical protein A3G39_08820 [Deltaproteobacteria bacterium RIFCSPLOWO2_12_FULL_43_16]|nr:MAG: hypothetical protein A2Z89_05855 [Deltaproteobacteria bacterium GWA2_43_19]OGQ09716.1 MAG: hypothetical protein A3D30_00615 [Deltaproteobacteria bacterium RIFCSPHIGHO2_02_FULL_43_33]OGQ44601.1 MAG: hypothetical protein A3A85_00790 [Deltaproteobacteria bacterium RIFCSPLOWO2_01_FULL_42_9]OGQ60276.1 MAG: hypothetical protein A3G39_08820 [Deltaproteobacteria bacterium RIFCSPLOWO2_12_FULL_43_16]HBR16045.1 hypothetical protein [Deltaproteobacteria bacterium]
MKNNGWLTISISTALSWLMKFIMIGMLPYVIYKETYLFAFATAVAIILSLLPSIVERNYRITLPFELDLLITLMIFLHTFFGEWLKFYDRLWVWDKILHVYGSAVISMLAFMIVYALHYTKKIRLTLPLVGLFTIIFAMAVGGFWEIGEFAVDKIFNKDTQNGLDNTMWDIINDLIGGTFVASMGIIYMKYSRPVERKRLTKPLGEIFGIKKKIERMKVRLAHK